MRSKKSLFVVIALSFGLLISALVKAQTSSPQQKPAQPPTQQSAQAPAKPPAKQDDPQKKKEPQRRGAEEDNQPETGEALKIDTDLVLLDVAVVDQTGKPIMNLNVEDFQVFEDKVKQTVEYVDRVDAPLSLGIVIDTSGSMRTKLQIVSDSALSLVKQLKEQDEAFIAQFKAEAELLRDFTRDKRELEDGLNELFTGGGTALLDAIIATADHAQEKGKQRKKALVVITDGVEKNSNWKEKEVIKAIQEDDVQVYLVGILDESEEGSSLFGKSATKKAKDLLIRLAEDSGGRAFFPREASEMPEVMAQVAKDLRSQYVVSYTPTNAKKDGTYRSVKVMVTPKDNRKLIVRTRQGYTAKGGPAQASSSDTKVRAAKPE
ncbi:MAG TPA: VWA domain-containing protein [Blastocatellia bacterium]|nr:VWA domain-containing protein [Blastocatellia bacterium]